MTKVLSTEEVNAHLSESIKFALQEGCVIITDDGKPIAAIVSYEDLAQLQRIRIARQSGGLADISKEWKNADEFAQELDTIVQQRYQSLPE